MFVRHRQGFSVRFRIGHCVTGSTGDLRRVEEPISRKEARNVGTPRETGLRQFLGATPRL